MWTLLSSEPVHLILINTAEQLTSFRKGEMAICTTNLDRGLKRGRPGRKKSVHLQESARSKSALFLLWQHLRLECMRSLQGSSQDLITYTLTALRHWNSYTMKCHSYKT